MTSAVAIIGLTFRATDIQSLPTGVFLELVDGIAAPPSVRGADTVVPGRSGRIAKARVGDVWSGELRGLVTGAGSTEAAMRDALADLRETMRALFDPTLLPGALVATLENGDTATIQARALPGQIWEIVVPSMYRVSIEVESVDPYWVIT